MLGIIKFVIALVIILFFAAAGWILFTHFRARRLGLPAPTFSSYFQNPFSSSSSTQPYSAPRPAPGGVVGWVNDKVRAFKNRNNRTAGGAYEEPLNTMGSGNAGAGGRRGRGFGPLDPDEAWDARVGTEADAYGPGGYYEEQELGLHADTGYAGAVGASMAPTPGQAPAGFGEDRGRSRNREGDAYIGGNKKGLDARYDEEMGVPSGSGAANPFGDEAEVRSVDLRGVSPRPIETTGLSSKPSGHGRQDSGDSPTERRSMFRENM